MTTVEVKKEEKKDEVEEDISEEEEVKLKLPFPQAAVVRIMKANMDKEKMIKKEVKIAMNKWLGKMCAQVAKEMNKVPYVTMHLGELKDAIRMYEDLEKFDSDKARILAHFDAMKKDIQRLEKDLGKEDENLVE